MQPEDVPTVTARLVDHAVAALTQLYRLGFSFRDCYQLCVGTAATQRGASLGALTPSELEAIIDLGLVMEAWRSTGDRRPPETHVEFLSALRRLGGCPCYLAGSRTSTGFNVDERHSAAVSGRPLRFQPVGTGARKNVKRPS